MCVRKLSNGAAPGRPAAAQTAANAWRMFSVVSSSTPSRSKTTAPGGVSGREVGGVMRAPFTGERR